MEYSPDLNDHGLRHGPLKALVSPRPIGWISSVSAESVVNLAPYSFFNMIAEDPAYVMFSSSGIKDSLRNAQATGEFVCNVVSLSLVDEMVATSGNYAPTQSEPAELGIAMRPSRKVRVPSVAAAHATLECLYHKTIELPGHNGEVHSSRMVIGRVVHVYVDDAVIVDGMVRTDLLQPVSRLGYLDYAVTTETFERRRPRI
jgi:flavin reductase (DIM6/NTAB) family NADH-FMN oxidoreductase RutF